MARFPTRHLLRAALTAAVLAAVVLLGQVPFGEATGRATLRLALRTAQGKVEVCRDLSAAELEALPAHMRQPRVCDEVAPPYRLRVAIDGAAALDEEFEPGGLRGDRPLIVDRSLRHPPGEVRLEIELAPVIDTATRTALAGAAAELPGYRLDRRVELPPDRVTLVLLAEASEDLRIYRDSAASP